MSKMNHGLRSIALAVGVLAAFACATRCCQAQEGGVSITIDPDVEIGRVKPVNGVGQAPLEGWIGTNMFHYLTEAGVPYSRLHDVSGVYGGNRFVDIPNVFRDFDADETNPENYDFAFTDRYIAALVAAGVEPYYRLGVTIENAYEIRALRIHPPKDYAKWARICEHVIRHYTEGWANGFHYKISHWEIWNEPDGQALWLGTFQQFLEFYEVASKHLKAKFPHLMIGGYGSSGLFKLVQEKPRPHDDHTMQCFLDFVRFCKERNCPVDFCSIHAYDMPGAWLTPEAVKVYGDFARKTLDEAGFSKTELSMNEWLPRWSDPGSLKQAALIAGLLVGFQHSVWNDAAIYDARCGKGKYSPFFDPSTSKPRKAYWAFRLFNELRRRGTEVKSEASDKSVQVLAARGKADVAALIVNLGERRRKLDLSAMDGWRASSCRIVNDAHDGTGTLPLPISIGAHETMLVLFEKGAETGRPDDSAGATSPVAVEGHEPSLLPAGRRFKLAWSDEFDGDKLDETKWSYRTNFWGRPAHWFAHPSDNAVEVRDGHVHLKVKKRSDGQFVSPHLQTGQIIWDIPDDGNTNKFWWLNARTPAKFQHRYGYWECRFKLQRRRGWCSAFWMQSENIGTTLDPADSGAEIDMLESFTPGIVVPHNVFACGYGKDERRIRVGGNRKRQIPDWEGWHTVGVLWGKDGYTFYMDGKEDGRIAENISHRPHFMLLSTECLGYRDNRGTGTPSPFLEEAVAADDEFVADYVRVWDEVE